MNPTDITREQEALLAAVHSKLRGMGICPHGLSLHALEMGRFVYRCQTASPIIYVEVKEDDLVLRFSEREKDEPITAHEGYVVNPTSFQSTEIS